MAKKHRRPTREEEEQAYLIAREEYKRKCETDFRFFIREAWHVLNPAITLNDGWYIDAIAEHLMQVRAGITPRLIINQPPRSLKTTITSEMFPCWWWATKPETRFVFNCYGFNLSVTMSLHRRRLIESPWYQSMWGDVFQMAPDENTQGRFVNNKTGHMTIVTKATGFGGDIMIVDDPLAADEAYSDAEREKSITFFRESLASRLDNPQSSSIVIVQQRLHDRDLTGVLLRDGGWTHLCLPVEVRQPVDVVLPLSGRVIHRTPEGGSLDPVRFTPKVLAERKVSLGPFGYAGQYMQEPAPPGGVIFKSEWWQWYEAGNLPVIEQVIGSVDATFGSKADSASECAIQCWGLSGINSYLLARDTRKRGFNETLAAIDAMAERWGIDIWLVEKKAMGSAIIETIHKKYYIEEISPDWGDKVQRAEACSPLVSAGTVFLPRNEDGVTIQTYASKFPASNTDDIDAMTQVLNYRKNRGVFMEWFRAQAEKAVKEETAPLDSLKPTNFNEGKTREEIQRELYLAQLEELGMKVPKMDKLAKAKDMLKKNEAATVTVTAGCRKCGNPSLFTTARGSKCMKCSAVYPR